MNSNPTFSVIVPVHNKGPHVGRSISSVLGQTFEDFELIIVDDASTDNSVEEIQKFKDSRIRLLHRDTPGPGGYAARNLGIEEAKAEWVAFLDADDEWLPDHLEKIKELADEFPECALLGCGWKNVVSDEASYLDSFFQHNSNQTSREILFKEYLESCMAGKWPLCMDTVCLRKNETALGLFPEGKACRGGDLHAWVIYLAHMKKMAWSPHVGAIYYRNSVNMVTKTAVSAPDLPLLMVESLSPYLDREHMKLLRRYANQRTWREWQTMAFFAPHGQFAIAPKLYWRGNVFLCTLRWASTLLPLSLFKLLCSERGLNGSIALNFLAICKHPKHGKPSQTYRSER